MQSLFSYFLVKILQVLKTSRMYNEATFIYVNALAYAYSFFSEMYSLAFLLFSGKYLSCSSRHLQLQNS